MTLLIRGVHIINIDETTRKRITTVGQSLSMCIVTVIVNLRLGDIPLQAAGNTILVNTIRICFAVFVILCIAGTLMSAARNVEDTRAEK